MRTIPLLAALSLAACGTSQHGDAVAPAAASKPQHLADRKVLHAIPLRVSTAAVVARIGTPARIVRGTAPARSRHKGPIHMVGITEYFYGVKGASPSATADLTFVHDKLASVLISGR